MAATRFRLGFAWDDFADRLPIRECRHGLLGTSCLVDSLVDSDNVREILGGTVIQVMIMGIRQRELDEMFMAMVEAHEAEELPDDIEVS
ncbi:hypothetical protein B2J88_01670 [Rhodococcus sp. SRB_17]|nr:hypothetical protein [Rhodococcus sp. SRB_17]